MGIGIALPTDSLYRKCRVADPGGERLAKAECISAREAEPSAHANGIVEIEHRLRRSPPQSYSNTGS